MCLPAQDRHHDPRKDAFQEIRENDEESPEDTRSYTLRSQSIKYYKVRSVHKESHKAGGEG